MDFSRNNFVFRLIAYLGVVSILSCCGNSKVNEGTIEFEVTYPYFNKTGFLSAMLPDKATMRFKGNKYKMEVKKGKAFSSAFLVDCDSKTLTTLFQLGQRRKYSVMDQSAVNKRLEEKFAKPMYMHTSEGDSIVGFLCRKSVAIFEEMGQPEATLMYTEQIGIKDPNWCLPYNEITGVLLVYEVEQYGIRMRFTAKKFDPAPVEDKMLEIPSNYKQVPVNDLEREIEEMFSTIVD
ncbi:MAG: hypothetical protein K1X56_01515 [Flavobacteriales bacterium]|nr:hypothetical protein [Flavobacteriales bacterium]